MAQKKKLKKNNDYGIIIHIQVSSYISGVLIDQKHNSLFDIGVHLGQFNLLHKMYVSDISLHNTPHVVKYDLDDVGNYATDKDDVIKKGDYVEVEDFPFANIMKRIMENLTKYNDKGKQEKDHVVINVGDNIDYVVNDSINIDEGFIPMSDEVHDGTEPINEGVTKDVDLCKRSKNKSNTIIYGNNISINVSIASLYDMYFHYEESVLNCILAESSCTQLLWSNQMLKDVIKDGNENFNQVVPNNRYDMLVNEFPTQRKDE
ncbi:unnamed protein product [Vicia faba]|uniref:Uncharacterized protein n=1 Tax=Vicia faba TaxID=3906 RepID=A0AAV1AWK9_VICFA|nr:unnamed protein product [Vicia faba]